MSNLTLRICLKCYLVVFIYCQIVSLRAVEALIATGQDRRIDLLWSPMAPESERFTVERAEQPEGLFVAIATGHRYNVYSDFIGENGRTYYYRVSEFQAGRKIRHGVSTHLGDDGSAAFGFRPRGDLPLFLDLRPSR